jgi:hypothetical protein
MANIPEDLVTQFLPVEKRIVDILKAILDDAKQQGWEWEMGKWTKRILEDLVNLASELAHAHKSDYRVACSGCEQAYENSEWLYDLVWWQQDGDYMSRIILVLESEWTPDITVDNDFLKLMLARADHHVWVFQAKTENIIRQQIQVCKEHLGQSQTLPSGDRFLFAGVSWNPREFYFDLYVNP